MSYTVFNYGDPKIGALTMKGVRIMRFGLPIGSSYNPVPVASVLQGGTVGVAYSETISVVGGVAPFTFSFAALPGGLTGNASTGVISGTPTTAGTTNFSVTVTDANGNSWTQTFQITIANPTSSGVGGGGNYSFVA